jgi:hypothetical protein
VLAPLRIAFDMDGTLADLSAAYAEMETRILGAPDEDAKDPAPEEREQQQAGEIAPGDLSSERSDQVRASRRRRKRSRDVVWRGIEETPNFWTTLKPMEDGVVKRLYQMTGELHWEVFFITQRPATAGATVQSQTSAWLIDQGFATPSVISLSGGRGKAAAALRLDYLVDDTPQNCVDVLADSSARPILILEKEDLLAAKRARRLGIGVAYSVHDVLDLLVEVTCARTNPTVFDKLKKMVGWK